MAVSWTVDKRNKQPAGAKAGRGGSVESGMESNMPWTWGHVLGLGRVAKALFGTKLFSEVPITSKRILLFYSIK